MAVARAERGKGMSPDDADPGNPSSPDDSRDGAQSQDPQPGQPATHELELDAYGMPVQDRPAKGRAYLLVAGCFFFGGVSAWLGIMNYLAKLPNHYRVAGCVLSALLTFGLAALLERENDRSGGLLKKQLDRAIIVRRFGIILACVGLISLVWFKNCGDNGDNCPPTDGPFSITPLAPLTIVQGHRPFQAGDAPVPREPQAGATPYTLRRTAHDRIRHLQW